MRCETYSRWMTAAAAGGLPAEQQDELRVHASLCAACREELAAAQSLAAAMDRTLAAMVSEEPSPAFERRARARLAAEPAPSRWLGVSRLRMAAGALAAVAVLYVVWVRSAGRVAAPGMDVAKTAPAASSHTSPMPETVLVTTPRERGRHAVKRAPLEFQILVPHGQLAAALEFSDALNAGRVDGTQLAALQEQSAKPLEWKFIEIMPLDRPSLEADAPAAVPEGANRF